jgi:RNA polymerase sigma-70 factor (ECF subfamily)
MHDEIPLGCGRWVRGPKLLCPQTEGQGESFNGGAETFRSALGLSSGTGDSLRQDLTSPEAFEALVREHQAMVFRTLTRMTGAGTHTEDLAQEVFLRLYRALPEFRGEAALSTYLYRIVVNVSQDEWKRRKKEREHIATEPADDDESGNWIENLAGDELVQHARNPEQLMADSQTSAAVEAALLELPEIERAVLVLYHQEERSYEGIAETLNLPINTVRTHLHRGRKRLGAAVKLRLGAPESVPQTKVHEAPKQAKGGFFSRAMMAMAGKV